MTNLPSLDKRQMQNGFLIGRGIAHILIASMIYAVAAWADFVPFKIIASVYGAFGLGTILSIPVASYWSYLWRTFDSVSIEGQDLTFGRGRMTLLVHLYDLKSVTINANANYRPYHEERLMPRLNSVAKGTDRTSGNALNHSVVIIEPREARKIRLKLHLFSLDEVEALKATLTSGGLTIK